MDCLIEDVLWILRSVNLPFGAFTENPYEIYEEVIQGNPSLLRNFKDRRAKKLIKTMLNLNPEMRHNGSYNSLQLVREHKLGNNVSSVSNDRISQNDNDLISY